MYAADGNSGSAYVRLLRLARHRCVQCRTPAIAVQLLLHVQYSKSACSCISEHRVCVLWNSSYASVGGALRHTVVVMCLCAEDWKWSCDVTL